MPIIVIVNVIVIKGELNRLMVMITITITIMVMTIVTNMVTVMIVSKVVQQVHRLNMLCQHPPLLVHPHRSKDCCLGSDLAQSTCQWRCLCLSRAVVDTFIRLPAITLILMSTISHRESSTTTTTTTKAMLTSNTELVVATAIFMVMDMVMDIVIAVVMMMGHAA